jgi:hypothetical protein
MLDGYHRGPHPDRVPPDRQKRLRSARRDARKVFTEIARDFIGEHDGSPIPRIHLDAAVGTSFYAVSATGASLKKEGFRNRAGRSQPVRTRGRLGLFRRGVPFLDKFLDSLPQRDNRILEETPPAVLWVGCHGREVRLHHPSGPELVDLDTPIAGPKLRIPARMVLTNIVEDVFLDLVFQILDP